MPYTLEEVANYSDIPELTDEIVSLGDGFAQAHEALTSLAQGFESVTPGASAVRCWPHHFDIATLIGLAEGDPETAPSIGVGFSPGDTSYAEPYLYCSPWPVPGHLPPAPSPWRWHTAGFTSLICTIETLDQSEMSSILNSAVSTVRKLLDNS